MKSNLLRLDALKLAIQLQSPDGDIKSLVARADKLLIYINKGYIEIVDVVEES